jgi:hypothetical protein
MRCTFAIATVGLLALAGLDSAAAQTPVNGPAHPAKQQRPGDAVDQAVGDLGPRIKSRRKVEPGLGAFSNRTKLYRRFDPVSWQKSEGAGGNGASPSPNMPQPYVYEAPGVRAYVDRPQYLSRQGSNRPVPGPVGNDGRFAQKVSANTVYDLIPRDHPASPLSSNKEPDSAAGRHQLNGIGERYRVDGRVSNQVNSRQAGRVAPSRDDRQQGERRAVQPPGGRADRSGRGSTARPNRGAVADAGRRTSTDSRSTEAPATQPGDDSRFGPNHPLFRDREAGAGQHESE